VGPPMMGFASLNPSYGPALCLTLRIYSNIGAA
jgi:hypothetical protein